MIDPSVLTRLRAYVRCEPDSRPPTFADLGALLAELDAAEVTPGGPMPEPWPGMGIVVVTSAGRKGVTVDPWWSADGTLRCFRRVGVSGGALSAADMFDAEEVVAVLDGRRCIWRRNP